MGGMGGIGGIGGMGGKGPSSVLIRYFLEEISCWRKINELEM